MNQHCTQSQLEDSWALVSHERLSVRKIAKLAGVSRGTSHNQRVLYRKLAARFRRLTVSKLEYGQARALLVK